MKKTIRILLPVFLVLIIVASSCWYLFVYDREFTRDMLVSFARMSENQGNHGIATWFYNQAYSQAGDNDSVAIELAQQHKKSGNYTKAEYTLSNAIADGGGITLYIELCKIYVEQDKLLDAVNMLNNVTNTEIKSQLEQMRPAAPTAKPAPGFYNQYISASVEAADGTLYVAADGQYPSTAIDSYSQPISLQDGENTLYAVVVGENGLVSPLSIFGYTIGGVIEAVEFADPAIEAVIRQTLGAAQTDVIYTNDLWKITQFTIPAEASTYADIARMIFLESLIAEKAVGTELHHLSSLSNLTELKITDTPVSTDDLASIAALPKLQNLTLSNCSLSSITPLQSTKTLEYLDLSNNTIRTITAISSLTNLKELNLQHNAVTEVGALTSLTSLAKLDISYNAIASLGGIGGLAALTWLDAQHNDITDLGNIDQLTSLTYLSLSSNKLADVSKLAGCVELAELNIAENTLTDISALNVLGKLTSIDFSYNQVKQIPAWEKDCALVTIDGSYNAITSLEPLKGLKHLNSVHMDYNTEIRSVKELASCPVLVEVNVYATKVTDVTSLTNQSIIVNYNPVQ